jgi:hypothetical protein
LHGGGVVYRLTSIVFRSRRLRDFPARSADGRFGQKMPKTAFVETFPYFKGIICWRLLGILFSSGVLGKIWLKRYVRSTCFSLCET